MNLKTKLSELLSPLGAGNNAYELGKLAQRQAALIEVLASLLNEADSTVSGCCDCIGFSEDKTLQPRINEALQKAKEAGYE